MSKRIKVVLFGLGRMGRNHLRVIRENPNFELVAVVDPKAAEPADLGSIKFLRDLPSALALDFETAVVATPTALHYDVTKALIGAGKHLLVEKPIASTFEQGRELIGLAKEKGLRLAVGHVERFNPAVRKLREVIRDGYLGAPIHFSFTRVGGYPDTLVQGNNVLLDLAVHDIDILRSMVGPVKMESSICHATWRPPVSDTAEIVLRAAKGPSASVHVNWITPTKIRTVRVTGTRGVCFVDYILQTCELFGGQLMKQIEPSSSEFGFLQELYKTTDKIAFGVQKEEPLRAQLNQFYTFLQTGESGELCLGKDAICAVLLAERAVEEGEKKKPAAPPPADALPTATDDFL